MEWRRGGEMFTSKKKKKNQQIPELKSGKKDIKLFSKMEQPNGLMIPTGF